MKKPEKPESKEKKYDNNQHSYKGKDSREGRLKEVSTDRGKFRHKSNRKDED